MVSYKFGVEGDEGVMEALKLLELNEGLLKFIKDKRGEWETFGRMNSHLYRKQLMERMLKKQLNKTAVAMVFFLASVIKSGPRIIKALDAMTDEEKKLDWWYPVKDFYTTETTQYVSQASKSQKFPVVNIPTCNPPLDILFFCLMTRKEDRTMDTLSKRPTFAQMDLMEEAQTKAKQGYEFYWTKVIQGTRNTDKPEAPGMKEDYYKNSAGDKYHFLSKNMEILMPAAHTGYTLEEVEDYMKSFE